MPESNDPPQTPNVICLGDVTDHLLEVAATIRSLRPTGTRSGERPNEEQASRLRRAERLLRGIVIALRQFDPNLGLIDPVNPPPPPPPIHTLNCGEARGGGQGGDPPPPWFTMGRVRNLVSEVATMIATIRQSITTGQPEATTQQIVAAYDKAEALVRGAARVLRRFGGSLTTPIPVTPVPPHPVRYSSDCGPPLWDFWESIQPEDLR